MSGIELSGGQEPGGRAQERGQALLADLAVRIEVRRERIAAEVSGPKVLEIVKGGNHVVNNRRYMYQTQAADWMAVQLEVPKS